MKESPFETMMGWLTSVWTARIVSVAAELGLADHMTDGSRTTEELAVATGTHAPSLHRLLRALAGAGVLHYEDGRYSLTPLGEALRSDDPQSIRGFMASVLGGEHYTAWGELLYSIRTGEVALQKCYGTDVWSYFAAHPERATFFNDAMNNLSAGVIMAVLASYDFSGISTIMDVGGGHGAMVSNILQNYPEMRGIVFDQPSVVDGALPVIERAGVADRCVLAAGNFFESVPDGADAHLLKFIIHDWNDEQSTQILKNCRRALNDGGKLLLIEAVIPPPNTAHFANLGDINMLVMTGGRERTRDEYAELYRTTGFELTKVIETPSPVSIIEGIAI